MSGRGNDGGELVGRIKEGSVGLDRDVPTERVVGEIAAKVGADMNSHWVARDRAASEIKTL